jgi:hypothetical protein
MVIVETVLSDRYVCQISYLSAQVKYLGELLNLAATINGQKTKGQTMIYKRLHRK